MSHSDGCDYNDHMAKRTAVGARELKTRLGTYLRRVREGTIIVVTERGKPIAEIRRLEEPAEDDARHLADLAARGDLTPAEGGGLEPFAPERIRGGALSGTLDDDRNDRV